MWGLLPQLEATYNVYAFFIAARVIKQIHEFVHAAMGCGNKCHVSLARLAAIA
jgi:hypothetical protein